MTQGFDKARSLRLERLEKMLNERLTHAAAALETLLSELGQGEPRLRDWEALHVAAARDDQEIELGTAYQKVLTRHRMRAFSTEDQARVLLHAADFFQGILGDAELARVFLQRVLEVTPDHVEAFDRLERGRKAAGEPRGLVDLYALVAREPPIGPETLATRAINQIVPLPASNPLDDETCRRLMTLVPSNSRLLDVVDAHLQKTNRSALALELRESLLADRELPAKLRVAMQRRLLERYLEAGNIPAEAIEHVEALLREALGDPVAVRAADKLMRVKSVASRAAALLRQHRLSTRPPPRR